MSNIPLTSIQNHGIIVIYILNNFKQTHLWFSMFSESCNSTTDIFKNTCWIQNEAKLFFNQS